MASPSADAVLNRLCEATGSTSDSQLAKALGVPQRTVSGWRTRGVVPYDQCVKVAIEQHLLLDKLVFGDTGPGGRLLDSELLRKCAEYAISSMRVFEGTLGGLPKLIVGIYEDMYDRIHGLNQYSESSSTREKVFEWLNQSTTYSERFADDREKEKGRRVL